MTDFLIILCFIVFVYACILITNCISTTHGETKTSIIEAKVNNSDSKKTADSDSKTEVKPSSKTSITETRVNNKSTVKIVPKIANDKEKIITDKYNDREDNLEFY